MNYHNITSPDMLNGLGLRTVLWVAGCTHNCPGCHNPITHPFDSGIPFTDSVMEEILTKSNEDFIEGLTLSGGDPFMSQNAYQCSLIAKQFKMAFPGKNIWAYSGFTFEQLMKRSDLGCKALLDQIDVLVDGRFIMEKKDPLLHFRGSSNQRIIDVKASIKTGSVVQLDI